MRVGTYYWIFNIDKKEHFTGHDIRDCIKYRSTFNGRVPKILSHLLRTGERWAGDRIEIVGDDSQPVRFDELVLNSETPEDLKQNIKEIIEEIKSFNDWEE